MIKMTGDCTGRDMNWSCKMAKDAYYFSHDSNAKDDKKCMLLIDQLGLEGYGIYWVLIETLRDQVDYKYPLSLVPILAKRYNTSAAKMLLVVEKFNFFEIDEDKNFFSLSLINRMLPLEAKKEQRRLAGIASGISRKERAFNERSTDVEQTANKNELSKVKKSKVKKSKVKKSKEKESKEELSDFKPLEVDFDKMIELYNNATGSDEISCFQTIHVRQTINEESNFIKLTDFMKGLNKNNSLEDMFYEYFLKAKKSWKDCNLSYAMNPKNYVKIWSYKKNEIQEAF